MAIEIKSKELKFGLMLILAYSVVLFIVAITLFSLEIAILVSIIFLITGINWVTRHDKAEKHQKHKAAVYASFQKVIDLVDIETEGRGLSEIDIWESGDTHVQIFVLQSNREEQEHILTSMFELLEEVGEVHFYQHIQIVSLEKLSDLGIARINLNQNLIKTLEAVPEIE